MNGTKYYYDGTAGNEKIFYISNGKILIQGEYSGQAARDFYNTYIAKNESALLYYKKAYEFKERMINDYKLNTLTYDNAYEEDGITKIWAGDNRTIFEFNNTNNINENIENDLSNFNQHRLAVIRHKIEKNLSTAISNYNKYSKATGIEFQMPELKEEEWDLIMNNISLISFVQGLSIGGKIYNGYTIVNNSENKEVVQEENIYILGNDNSYHKIGDEYLTTESNIVTDEPAGRPNLDFKRLSLTNNGETVVRYYYPLPDYYGSYDSVVMQNTVTTYDDIYAYIGNQSDTYKKAFYMALGREREGAYKALRTNILEGRPIT